MRLRFVRGKYHSLAHSLTRPLTGTLDRPRVVAPSNDALLIEVKRTYAYCATGKFPDDS